MEKKRNGLLEIYRLILSFWPMYYHNFFFIAKNNAVFTVAPLTVDFFFVLSGLFLVPAINRMKEYNPFVAAGKIMIGKIKPLIFTLGFITAFNLVCLGLFIRENHFSVLFELFKYWWYVLYMVLVSGIYCLLYRAFKSEKAFGVFLFVTMIVMCIFHYQMEIRGRFIYEFTFVVKAFGCIALGILLSYIPKIPQNKPLGFNYNIPIVAVLFLVLLYLTYHEKTYNECVIIILLFCALVYFSMGISVSGEIFDLIGKLSTRLYLYMAFVTMLYYLGITNHRQLFIIDLSVASIDLAVDYYRTKYRKLKTSVEK